MSTFDTLVISGGGIRGISALGAIYYCEQKQLIENVSIYVGCSIGAIMCYLLAIGYTPLEIIVYMCTKEITEKLAPCPNIAKIIEGDGICDYANLNAELEKLTVDKIGNFLTLGALKEKIGKSLICSVFNYTESKVEYLSPESHPDMPCLTALKMSSNLPFVFDKFKYMGSYYLDGGIGDNFPIKHVDTEGHRILGILLDATQETQDDFRFLEYIYNLLYISLKQTVEHILPTLSERCKVIRIQEDSIKFFQFNLSKKEKLDMFSRGFSLANRFFDEI